MSEPYQALQIPPLAKQKGGTEVLRAAIIEGGLHVTLRPAFNEPQAWGLLLADVLRQVARAYGQSQLATEADAFKRIRTALIAELDAPPDSGAQTSIAPIE
jgi:hypothetical protein